MVDAIVECLLDQLIKTLLICYCCWLIVMIVVYSILM